MAVSFDAIRESEGESLTVVEAITYNGKRLAVVETSTGDMHGARERSRPVADSDGKRPRQDSSGKDRPRENYWKRTSALSDYRDMIAGGLLAL